MDVKKPSRPPVFAFVEFDDPRDAADACRGRDGYEFAGDRIRVSPIPWTKLLMSNLVHDLGGIEGPLLTDKTDID